VLVDDSGENSIMTVAGANALLGRDGADYLVSNNEEIVILQLETPPKVVIEILKAFRLSGHGGFVSIPFTLRLSALLFYKVACVLG